MMGCTEEADVAIEDAEPRIATQTHSRWEGWRSAALVAIDRPRRLLRWLNDRYGWMSPPLAIALAVRVVVFVFGSVGAKMGVAPFPGILLTWMQKDAWEYTDIAHFGYSIVPANGASPNFFPLYPAAIWLVQHATGLIYGDRPQSYLLAGQIVSWACFLAAAIALYRLVCDRFGQSTAYLAVLLIAVFPFSLFYGAAYTESPFLLLAVLAFLGIERENWWQAGICSLLAGAVRPTGVLVGAAVIVAYGLDWLRVRHRLRWDVLALALTPLGTLAYFGYCWVRLGDPLAYAKASAGWGGGSMHISGIVSALTLLVQPGTWFTSDHLTILHLMFVLAWVGSLVACYWIWRLLGIPYALYTFAGAVVPLLDFTRLESLGRYMSVLFPVFIVLAYALRNKPMLRDVVIITFTLFLGICTVAFTSNIGIS